MWHYYMNMDERPNQGSKSITSEQWRSWVQSTGMWPVNQHQMLTKVSSTNGTDATHSPKNLASLATSIRIVGASIIFISSITRRSRGYNLVGSEKPAYACPPYGVGALGKCWYKVVFRGGPGALLGRVHTANLFTAGLSRR